MPYDVTLLPVSRRVILDVAKANVQSLLGLAPVQRSASEISRDALLGPVIQTSASDESKSQETYVWSFLLAVATTIVKL